MFSLIAERKIRVALENGEFDNLPNAGRPVDLDEYFAVPEHLRVGHALLKQAGCVPEEVTLLAEVGALEARADLTPADAARLESLRLRLAVLMERRRSESRAHQRELSGR